MLAKEDAAASNNASDKVQTPDENAQAAQQAEDSAQTAVVDSEQRIRDLEAKLTREGRTQAQIKVAKDQLERERLALQSDLAAAKKANDNWQAWYLKNHATPAEQAAANVQSQSTEKQALEKQKRENVMLRAILTEEDPAVKQVLTALADDGNFMDKGEIEALRKGMGAKTATASKEEPDDAKEPPKVTAKRSSNTAASLDQQLEEAKKRRDTTAYLNLLAEKQKLKNAGT